MKQNPTIRHDALPKDIVGVRDLLAPMGMFYPHEIDVAVELVEDRLTKGDKSEYYFIMADDGAGELCGYICYGPITMTDARFDIYWIAVRSDMRGSGLAAGLLKDAEDGMIKLGAKGVFVETSSKDGYKAARRFYEKNGYAMCARVVNFYADGDDKMIYCRFFGAKG